MIDGAVVPLPEGYHAFLERATRWIRNGLGPAPGAERQAGSDCRSGGTGRVCWKVCRPHGGDGDRQMGTTSDAAVRGKSLILLNGDKVTPVALPDSLIKTYTCDSHLNNTMRMMKKGTIFQFLPYHDCSCPGSVADNPGSHTCYTTKSNRPKRSPAVSVIRINRRGSNSLSRRFSGSSGKYS
jgi:hypothetical protein